MVHSRPLVHDKEGKGYGLQFKKKDGSLTTKLRAGSRGVVAGM